MSKPAIEVNGLGKRFEIGSAAGGYMLLTEQITERLRRRGYLVVGKVQSFLVSKQNVLGPAEAERARTWGAALAFTAGPFRHATPTA